MAEAEETQTEDAGSSEPAEQEAAPVMSDEVTGYEQGEEMARLEIPEIENAYKTFWGADDATLKQGVGMYVSEWTTTPDQKRHTVLSGHRDTVFTELESWKPATCWLWNTMVSGMNMKYQKHGLPIKTTGR